MRKFLLTLMVICASVFSFTLKAQLTLTVADGTTTNEYVPVYGWYEDAFLLSQVIYPSNLLTNMMGGSISSLTFYLSSSATLTSTFAVKLGTTTASTFSSSFQPSPSQTVYTGTFTINSSNQITINFTTPFVYSGGNLLLEISTVNTLGNYAHTYYYGTSSSASSIQSYDYDDLSYITTGSPQNFIPKTTFGYLPSGGNFCYPPTGLTISNVTANSADLSWTAGDSETEWELMINGVPQTVYSTSYSLTGLNPSTSYSISVRSICGVGDTSFSINTSFLTSQIPATLPYTQDWESVTENSQWTIDNSDGTNKWCIGGAVTGASGDSALYISSDNGLTHSYDVSSTSNVWAYRDIDFDHIYGEYVLSFDFVGNGESGYDYTRMYIGAPATPSGSSAPAGSVLLGTLSLVDSMSHFTATLSSDFAGVQRIYLLWHNDLSAGTQPPAAFDNLHIEGHACGFPHHLAMDTATQTTVDFHFSPSLASDNMWDAVIVQYGDTLDETQAVTIYDTAYQFSNLTANTAYTVYVRTNCGSEVSTWSSGLSVHTECPDFVPAPYFESFEGMGSGTSAFPHCWTRHNTYSNDYPYINTAYHSDGATSLYFYTPSGYYSYAASDAIDVSNFNAGDLAISFKLSPYSSLSYARMDVGIMTDPSDFNTFTLLASYYPSDFTALNTWHSFSVPIPQAYSTPIHVAFYTPVSSSTTYMYLDEVRVDAAPICSAPTNLEVSNIAGSSAMVSWTASQYGDGSYTLEYSDDNSNWNTQTTNETSMLLTGLTQGTTYYVRVYRNCTSGDSDTLTDSFSTVCLVGGDLAIGNGTSTTTSLPGSSCYNYAISEQLFVSTELGGQNTFRSLSIQCSSAVSTTRTLDVYMMPTTLTALTGLLDVDSTAKKVFSGSVSISSGNWFTIQFDSTYTYDGNSNLILIVNDRTGSYSCSNYYYVHTNPNGSSYYKQNDGSAYDPAAASTISSPSSTSYRNNVIFGASCDSNVTCVAPNAFISDKDYESIEVTWAPGYNESAWEMEYKDMDDTTATWTPVANPSSPQLISNLNAGTTYSIRLRSSCGGTNFSDWVTLQTKTECTFITTLPFTEDFENTTGSGSSHMVPCWTRGTNYSSPYPYTSNSQHTAVGTYSLYFYGTSAYYSYAATPRFDDSILMDTLQIHFYAKKTASTYFIEVGIMEDPEDYSTFTLLGSFCPSQTTDFEMGEIVTRGYTGNGHYVAFRCPKWATSYIYLDDVSIDYIPSCVHVNNVHAASVDSTSATITWVPGGSETDWEVYVMEGTGAVDFDTVVPASVTETTYVASDLLPGTLYTAYVRGNCGFEYSDWISGTFRTTQTPGQMPYFCDFEDGHDQFGFENGTSTNKWYVGTAVNNGGTHAMYVSNDNGATNSYSSSSGYNYAWAFRDIYFPACSDGYNFSFDWRCTGESSWDYMKVYFGDPVQPTPNSETPPTGSTAVGGNFNQSSGYQTYTTTLPGLTTGAVKRIYFLWRNDGSGNYPPAASVDNISISPIYCAAPSNLTVTNVGTSGATLTWTTLPTISNCVLYYKADNDADWTPITSVSSPYTLSGLTQSTHYTVRVVSDCGDGEHVSPAITAAFTTTCDCSPVENLTVSQIVGTSAMLTWSDGPNGTASSYSVEYTEANQNNWTPAATNLTTPMCMLSGLNPTTDYDVRVKVFCNDNTESIWFVEHFTTGCMAGGDIQIGNGAGTSSYFPSYNFYNYSLTEQLFTSTELGGANTFRSISFQCSTVNASSRTWAIYLYPTTASSLTSVVNVGSTYKVFEGTVNISEGWFTIPFTTSFNYDGISNLILVVDDNTGSYVSSNSYVGHTISNGSSYYDYSDATNFDPATTSSLSSSTFRNNVIFGGDCDSLATCIAPNMYVSNITSSSADINWVPGYLESAWEMEYALYGDSIWTPVSGVTGNTVTIPNLTPATRYKVRMRSDCGGGDVSSWAACDFKTECDVFAIPFSENFNNQGSGNDAYPDCWSRDNNYSTSAYPYISTTEGGSLYFLAGSSTYNLAVTPELNASLNTLAVSFDLRTGNVSNGIVVGIMDDPDSLPSFVPVDTVFCTTTGVMQSKVVYLNNYTGNGKYVAFMTYNTSSAATYIDNVTIDLLPTCFPVTDLTVSATTATSVTLTWTDANNTGATYSVYDMDNANTPIAQNVSGTTYTVTGLTAATAYTFGVEVNCSPTDASTMATVTTSTECADITTFPYTEGFENGLGCWQAVDNNNDGSTWRAPITFSSGGVTPHTGDGMAGSFSWNSSVLVPDDYLISPKLVLPASSTITLSWYFVVNGSYPADKYSVYVATGNTVADFTTPLFTIVPDSSHGTWTQQTLDLSAYAGQQVYVAFRHYDCTDMNYVMLDDITITAVGSTPQPDTCLAPSNLTATGMTKNSVVLNWTENGTATSWTVNYKEENAANMSTATASSKPYTLTGLQPGTTYTVNVVANCANGQSEPSNTVTFTTEADGIADYEMATSLYPNPNNGQFTVASEQYTVNSVQIYDVYGKLLKTVVVNGNTAVIDAHELSAGMYFVRISTEKGVVTKSFVKK